MSDALSALRTALAPKGGMQRIPFPLETYEHPSLPLVAKRLLNLMAEQQPNDARTAAALVSTPGLLPYLSVGPGPILAMNDDLPGRIYVVSGSRAYRMNFEISGLSIDDLGDVGLATESNPSFSTVTIAVGATAAVICVPPIAFTCEHEVGRPLNQIGGGFPGASSVCHLDGYYVFSPRAGSDAWFISKLLDPTAYDALDFVYADAVHTIRRVIAHRGQIWLVAESGMEVWYDAGQADFPFRRASGGVIPTGTNSPMSVCRADQSVWWVGVDGVVYRSDGYQERRVSTHAIEAILGAGGVIGLHALTHAYRGHWFYVLTTNDSRTLVFDMATKAWHERSTSTDASLPWQASIAAVDNNSIHLFGDRSTGQLYTLGMQATDAGVTVLRVASLPPLWAGTKRAFCARVEIEMEVGGANTPGSIGLQWSDDGARTWGTPRTMSAGLPAELRHRVYTTRLGSFRDRSFRIRVSGLVRLYAVDADISPGQH